MESTASGASLTIARRCSSFSGLLTACRVCTILRRQGMPSREIRAVAAADDPLVVQRLLELHRERLEEWLEEQLEGWWR